VTVTGRTGDLELQLFCAPRDSHLNPGFNDPNGIGSEMGTITGVQRD